MQGDQLNLPVPNAPYSSIHQTTQGARQHSTLSILACRTVAAGLALGQRPQADNLSL